MKRPIISLLPWILVLLMAAGLYQVRKAGQSALAELDLLRDKLGEVETLRAENNSLRNLENQTEELARLRRDNESLHRLRNEVRKLREDNLELSNTVVQVRSTQPDPQLLVQLQQENLRLRDRADSQPVIDLKQTTRNACINNLRQIDAAKEQWALEHRKAANTLVAGEDLLAYFGANARLQCPDGGHYQINPVGASPACSMHGHIPPPQ